MLRYNHSETKDSFLFFKKHGYLPLKTVLLLLLVLAGQPFARDHSLKENIKRHTAFLASDSLMGRGTGSYGSQRAAEYIVKQSKKMGLKAFGKDGTWFQNVPMHGSKALTSTTITLTNGSMSMRLRLFDDFLLYNGGVQTFIPNPVSLVFVGYGISAPEFDYNDYLTQDVDGKIVVFLSGEPYSQDDDYFAGAAPTVYSYPEAKQRTAIAHGALGSILLQIPKDGNEQHWWHYQKEFSFEDITLAYRVTGNLSVLLNATDSLAQFLFRESGYGLQDVVHDAMNHTMRSFPLKTKLQFNGSFLERDFIGHNVVGLLPANTVLAKDEYVIVSAHYDHLGVGLPVAGDSIYNGAMDNAVGVAGTLELARLLNTPDIKRNRSLIFLFCTGEEHGLLGSAYYTDHPLVPLYKTTANLNIDGLAMFDMFAGVVGVGAEYSDLGELLVNVAEQESLIVSPVPPQFLQYESFSRSDQMSFAWAGIPSILIMDGLNYRNLTPGAGLQKWLNWNNRIYHSPFDDMHQPVNWKAVARHVRFLASYVQALLNTERTIQWKNNIIFKNIRLQTIAEQR